MALYLYRIGKFAYRRKGVVLAAWLVLAVLFGLGASLLAGPTSDNYSIPGTPAQRAQDLLAERFPAKHADPTASTSARFVFASAPGQTLDTAPNRAAMDAVLATLTADPNLKPSQSLTNPVVGDQKIPDRAFTPLSPDKTVGYVDVLFDGATSSGDRLDSIEAAKQVGRAAGLTVEVSGTAAQQSAPPGGTAEAIGLAVAAVVLILTFGSLVAAGLPLITAVVGIAIGALGIAIATGFMELSAMTYTLAVMIGLAVAIDYSLFIVSRYRHEVVVHADRAEAAGRAVATAGSAVVFAGLTVIIALVALRVAGIPFLSDMGAAAGFTVAVAVLIAITLLPAVLGVFGAAAFAGRVPMLHQRDPEVAPRAERYARFLTRRPLLTLAAGVALLAAVAVPALGLTLAVPGQATSDPSSSPRKAYDLIDAEFGPGRNGPLLVVVDARHATVPREQLLGAVVSTIKDEGDVEHAQVIAVNGEGDAAQVVITPKFGPRSAETKALVERIRDAESELRRTTGVTYGVTGQAAMEIDISNTLADALVPYLAVVVGLAFVLLMLVFRSVLVPLTATLGFLLSMAATFGAIVAIFQEGWLGLVSNPQPIVSFMPIFLIGVVFGLAMDYQVFLVSRIREEYIRGASARQAIVAGCSHGARVVTAAALIMMSVFAAFIAEPDTFIKAMGFALAAAVFFDAFIVRMVIIPSVLAVLGDRVWWLPRWLDRVLPDVDIEGRKLECEFVEQRRELASAA